MKYLITLFTLSFVFNINAQKSFYDCLNFGNFEVGFCDSLIYCESEEYVQHDYSGQAPLFLQIWHPITKSNSNTPLTYADLRSRKLNQTLNTVYDSLTQKMDSSFVWYNISEDCINYDEIDYGKYSTYDVLDSIKNFKTKSYKNLLPLNSNFPVIVYHHGSQGQSDENFYMAEYFASKGYIFVSSNFHHPYSKLTYGLDEMSDGSEVSMAKQVTKFARTLTSNKELYYIGHSKGAQIGFSYLYEHNMASAFVSMETTLEFWDSTKISKLWPSLNTIMIKHQKDYTLPILMFANTKEEKAFNFFKNITNSKTIHVSAKEEFTHESYTSGYLLRYFYNSIFPQPDSKELKRQVELYVEHLKIIEEFLKSCATSKEPDLKKYKNNFFISSFN